MIKSIYLGILDYINDVKHDKKLKKERDATDEFCVNSWRPYRACRMNYYVKEGNVWHYIRQRMISRNIKRSK